MSFQNIPSINSIQSWSGMIETPEDKEYTLELSVPFAGTINSLAVQTASGTCEVTVNIDGVNVDGFDLSASDTVASIEASGANVFAAESVITLVVSSNSSAADLQFTIQYTR
jgi:nicotinate-nucleotide pyrophosphorylase